jgi:predicted TIM-barrel fold metal-dependent hydrolase
MRHLALRSEDVNGLRRWYDHRGRAILTGDQWQTLPGEPWIEPGPERRLRDLESQGIWAETFFPNLGLFAFAMHDPDLAMATARVYNDYLIEAYGEWADRLLGIALIPTGDIPSAVAETERVASLGLRGILVPQITPYPYHRLDVYAPLWAAAEANGLVVSFHIGTGIQTLSADHAGGGALKALFPGTMQNEEDDAGDSEERTQAAMRSLDALCIGREAQEVIAGLVGSGTLEQFPQLHFVSVENNANWLAHTMAALDKACTRAAGQPERFVVAYHGGSDKPEADEFVNLFNQTWPYPLMPSEYLKQQVHVTFMDDPAAIALRHFTGVDALLWGADYPHPEGTFPRTSEALSKQFDGVDEEDQAAIVGGTLASLYDIRLPEPAR